MRKNILTLIVAAFCMAISASATIREVQMGVFTKLQVNDDINVVYSTRPDSIGFVQYESAGFPNNAFIITRNKETLKIEVDSEYESKENKPTIYVYSQFLESVSNEGNGVVRILDVAAVPSLTLKTWANGKIIANDLNITNLEAHISTGKGKIVVSGNVITASFKLTGTGEINADKLVVKDEGKCRIVGTGTIGCCVKGKLSVSGTGTGKVYYVGKPSSISKKTLGPIKVISLDTNEEQ